MGAILAAILVAGLGNDRFQTREACEAVLRELVLAEVGVAELRAGARSADPEVRVRCERVADTYEAVPLAPGLTVDHFPCRQDALAEWNQAKADQGAGGDEDASARVYVRLLFARGLTRTSVLAEVAGAGRERRRQGAVAALRDAGFDAFVASSVFVVPVRWFASPYYWRHLFYGD